MSPKVTATQQARRVGAGWRAKVMEWWLLPKSGKQERGGVDREHRKGPCKEEPRPPATSARGYGCSCGRWRHSFHFRDTHISCSTNFPNTNLNFTQTPKNGLRGHQLRRAMPGCATESQGDTVGPAPLSHPLAPLKSGLEPRETDDDGVPQPRAENWHLNSLPSVRVFCL